MNDAPNWIIKFLNSGNICCGLCNKKFSEEDLISIGIQESIVDPNKDMLTIGMYCEDCHEVTLAEIKEMSLVDLSIDVLESEEDEIREDQEEIENMRSDYRKNKKKCRVDNNNKNNRKGAGISKKDVSNVSRFLKSIDSHDELLTAMGMLPEEIEKIKKEGEKERKKNNNGK